MLPGVCSITVCEVGGWVLLCSRGVLWLFGILPLAVVILELLVGSADAVELIVD